MALNCIIIGSDPKGFHELENYLLEVPDVYLVGRFPYLEDADVFIKAGAIDILIMGCMENDPELDVAAIDFLPIFVMLYDENGRQITGLSPVGELTLPITLSTVLNEFFQINNKINMEGIEIPSRFSSSFSIRTADRTEKVQYADLQYVEVMNDHIMLHLSDQKIVTAETLDVIVARLPGNMFMRVHRWFVVNFNHIDHIGDNYVEVADGVQIRLTSAMRLELLKRYRAVQ